MSREAAGEGAFRFVMIVVLFVTYIGVLLAQFDAFSGANWLISMAGAVAILGVLVIRRPRAHLGTFFALRRLHWQLSREQIAPLVLVLLAALLYALPTEHYPLLGDSAIYPNTGALLVRTHSLRYDYAPLTGLTPEEKRLFYVPSNEQISGVEIQGYQGILYGAYYVINRDTNQILASRPAAFIVWMAIFYGLFGEGNVFWATPVFGVLGVVAVYVLGARLFGIKVGFLAALLLAIGFPQIHFARAPYSEVMAQTFIIAGLYGLVAYLDQPRRFFLFFAAANLGAALLTRIDTLAILLPIAIFMMILLTRKDWRNGLVFVLLMGCVFGVWALNTAMVGLPYMISSWQLFSKFVFVFLQAGAALPVLMVGGTVVLGLTLHRHGDKWVALAQRFTHRRFVKALFAFTLIAIVLYLYYFRAYFPEPGYHSVLNNVLPKVGAYFTPLILFASVIGLIVRFWFGWGPKDLLFSVFFLLFAGLFLWRYTTAPVYPVAVRRFIPEVIPAMLIMGAYAVASLPSWWKWQSTVSWLKPLQAVLVALMVLGQLSLSLPYWLYRESAGTTAFTQELARKFPNDAVAIFEPTGEKSQVGWFASPLWSLYGKNALLLVRPSTDERLFTEVVTRWRAQGRAVYYISQSNPPPLNLPGMSLSPAGQMKWNSSIIGQSGDLFPPYTWRFEMPFWIYQLSDTP